VRGFFLPIFIRNCVNVLFIHHYLLIEVRGENLFFVLLYLDLDGF
jgi:hypothetical protein